MPDHVHVLLILTSATGQIPFGLAQVMQVLKGASARAINELRGTPRQTIWQRGYYERVIRNEGEMEKYRNYLLTNPLREKLGL